MIKTVKIVGFKNNIYFVANLIIFSCLINYYLVGGELFTDNWLYSAFALILSYGIYSLISDVFIDIKEKDLKLKRTKEDAIRYMTIYTFYQFFVVYIEKGIFELSFSWLMKTCIIIGSYVSFDYIFTDLVFNLNNYNVLLLDIFKIGLAEIIGAYVITQQMNIIEAADLIAYIFSYLIWILFTKKFLT